MTRIRLFGLLSTLSLLTAHAFAAEKSFDGVTCEMNIPSALIGRRMPNERVAATQARYKGIGLKDLGAYGTENGGDSWTLISWQICGREYLLLERREIVRDVLASPLPPGSPQSQITSCTVDGASLPGTAVAFVSTNVPKGPMLVEYAWRINDTTIKFAKIAGREIVCAP
jgi:hypothetical protein